MNFKKSTDSLSELQSEKITPWNLMTLIKPVLSDELVAKLRFDRYGIKITFYNGQKFHLSIKEL